MGWPQCNTTLEDERINETSLFEDHDFTFHKLGLWLSAIFGAIAVVVSFFLMYMHLIRYSKPTEQRHIVRILFMVPVYAAVSFLSYLYYTHSVYFEVLRDCYEAFAIASFFSLLCAYIAPDLHTQKDYFRTITPRDWIWPMGWFQKCCGGKRGALRTPRSGLTWFNVIWVSVFQYCLIRVTMTIVAVVTQYFDRYCLESLNPAFSHVWVMVIEATAVTVAMYCLVQFYVQIRNDIKQHKPLLKVLAIKLVIFLSFWQTIIISFLTSSGAITASDRIQTPDIKIGIPAMLLCVEMAIFAVFHLWAFSWKPYVIGSPAWQTANMGTKNSENARYFSGPLGVKAFFDVFNPWDMVKAIGRSAKWLFRGRKHRMSDISYATALNGSINQTQKLNELEQNTSYPSQSHDLDRERIHQIPAQKLPTEEGQTLLSAAQANPHYPPPSPTSTNLQTGTSMAPPPWEEVEQHEYIQSQTYPTKGTHPQPQLQAQPQSQSQSQAYYGQPDRSYQQQPSASTNTANHTSRSQSQRHNFSRPITPYGQGVAPPSTSTSTQEARPPVERYGFEPQQTGVTNVTGPPYPTSPSSEYHTYRGV